MTEYKNYTNFSAYYSAQNTSTGNMYNANFPMYNTAFSPSVYSENVYSFIPMQRIRPFVTFDITSLPLTLSPNWDFSIINTNFSLNFGFGSQFNKQLNSPWDNPFGSSFKGYTKQNDNASLTLPTCNSQMSNIGLGDVFTRTTITPSSSPITTVGKSDYQAQISAPLSLSTPKPRLNPRSKQKTFDTNPTIGLKYTLAQNAKYYDGRIKTDAQGNKEFSPGGIRQHWCCDFVSSLVRKTYGQKLPSTFKHFSAVSDLRDWAIREDCYKKAPKATNIEARKDFIKQNVKVGDIQIEKEGKSHTGIVTFVASDGSYYRVTEGNSGNKVQTVTYHCNSPTLSGFVKFDKFIT